MGSTTTQTMPAQQAAYSLDYYSLNKVFYGPVNTHQSTSWQSKTKTPQPATQEKSTKKHSSFLPFLGRRHQSPPPYAEVKSTSCSTSDRLSSPRSSFSS